MENTFNINDFDKDRHAQPASFPQCRAIGLKFAKKGNRPGMFSDLLGIKTMPGKEFITPPDPKAVKIGKEKFKREILFYCKK